MPEGASSSDGGHGYRLPRESPMRPPRIAVRFAVAGVLLGILFLALGGVSGKPSDHPRWVMAGSWSIALCYTILTGFCLPAFFLHFSLASSVCALGNLTYRPGEIPCPVMYPLLQGVLYGGVVWAMWSGVGAVRRLLPSRGAPPETVTIGVTSETQPCQRSRLRLAAVVSIFLIAYSVGSLCLLVPSLPPAWTADYDRARYTQISDAIANDEYRRLGKPFDEVATELGLEEVPWDKGFGQSGEDRIYHFRGFALYINLVDSPRGLTSHGADVDRRGVQWISPYPFVRIDGISDRNERMEQYWEACNDECNRINREVQLERQRNDRRTDVAPP
jgi:hypothetical protein